MKKIVFILLILVFTSLVACTNKNQITINFDSNGGSIVESILINLKGEINLPNEPVKEGYIFDGWYFDNATFSQEYLETSDLEELKVKNITVYAKWLEVDWTSLAIENAIEIERNHLKINVDNETTSYAFLNNVIVESGSSYKVYFDISGTNEITTKNISLEIGDNLVYIEVIGENLDFEIYTVNVRRLPKYEISFYSNGGSAVSKQYIQENEKIEVSDIQISRDGYSLEGWYLDYKFTNEHDSTFLVTENTMLYAKWKLDTYSIEYILDGVIDNSFSPKSYTIEDMLVLPTVNSEGCTFSGWYLDDQMSGDEVTNIRFGTFGNIKLYGNISVNEYSIQYAEKGADLLGNIVFDVDEEIIEVSAGFIHNIALTNKGRVFTWGDNSARQLGDGTTIEFSSTPIDITSKFVLQADEIIIKVSSGFSHSMALTNLGSLFTWGDNSCGQLGVSILLSMKPFPTKINQNITMQANEKIVDIASGATHSAALTSLGRFLIWGDNSSGQLGDGTTVVYRASVTDITSKFSLLVDENIFDFSLGFAHSLVLTNQGRLFTWGDNSLGQLGDGTDDEYRSIPTNITSSMILEAEDSITKISSGFANSMALTNEGRLFVWGDNSFGQLGDGRTVDYVNTPNEITEGFNLETGDKLVEVSLGFSHSMALTKNGHLFTWGNNELGQLGDGTILEYSSAPIDITINFSLEYQEKINNLSSGFVHSIALTNFSSLFTWGDNSLGQLGDKTDITHKIFPALSAFRKSRLLKTEKYLYDSPTIKFIPIKPGAIFNDWYTDSELTNKYYFTKMPAQDLALYVKWDILYYPIKYELNGGINDELNPESYTIEDNIELGVPTKEGHTFKGWYNNQEFTGDVVTKIYYGSLGKINLYAKWEINTYKITFNPMNGEVSQTYKTVTYGEALGEFPIPTREGYTFLGYYSLTYGDGIKLNEEDIYNFDSDITIYAKWNEASIVFNIDGNISQTTIIYGSTIVEPENPVKEGYRFLGWWEKDSDYLIDEAYNFSTLVETNVYLNAVFEKIPPVLVTYNLDGGHWVYTTKEDMSEAFVSAFNTYSGVNNTVENFFYDSLNTGTKLTDFFFDEEQDFGWMYEYICNVANAQAHTSYNNLYPVPNNSYLRAAVWAFLNNTVLTSYPRSANFSANEAAFGFWEDYFMENNFEYERTTAINTVYKDGYTFVGWYDNFDFTGEAITIIEPGEFTSITLYALFIEIDI